MCSPADKCGEFSAGDTLLKVDNRDLVGMTIEQISKLIIGATGSQVVLTGGCFRRFD